VTRCYGLPDVQLRVHSLDWQARASIALCAEAIPGRGAQPSDRKEFAKASNTFANCKELSMNTTAKALRRSLYAVCAASAVGGAAAAAPTGFSAPSATAASG